MKNKLKKYTQEQINMFEDKTIAIEYAYNKYINNKTSRNKNKWYKIMLAE